MYSRYAPAMPHVCVCACVSTAYVSACVHTNGCNGSDESVARGPSGFSGPWLLNFLNHAANPMLTLYPCCWRLSFISSAAALASSTVMSQDCAPCDQVHSTNASTCDTKSTYTATAVASTRTLHNTARRRFQHAHLWASHNVPRSRGTRAEAPQAQHDVCCEVVCPFTHIKLTTPA